MRRCPNCSAVCEVGTGIFFDANRNICCYHCKKFILAIKAEDETKIDKPANKKTSNVVSYAAGGTNQHSYVSGYDDCLEDKAFGCGRHKVGNEFHGYGQQYWDSAG